jgi:hypothetical protein
MDATELFKHKQTLTAKIPDAVARHDIESLKALSNAVHDLELELLESFWELDRLRKGVKHSPASRLRQTLFVTCEDLLRRFSILLMSEGVSIASRAARIRGRLKREPVPLNIDRQERSSLPLDQNPNHKNMVHPDFARADIERTG